MRLLLRCVAPGAPCPSRRRRAKLSAQRLYQHAAFAVKAWSEAPSAEVAHFTEMAARAPPFFAGNNAKVGWHGSVKASTERLLAGW
eukprot:4464776-Pyramimonas_sp.AAC.1